ncbi:DUF5362 family protein [Pedobacter sp.]|uniref:DUF5362 family protein n=1 Tax=Pedobacter sp. TaxID=1411316 RepID=UPI00396C6FCA
MDNQTDEKQEQGFPQLIVTEDMRSYIYDMAKWANFLAIVGFFVSALLVLTAMGMSAAMTANPELGKLMGPMGGVGASVFGIMFFVQAVIVFVPSLLLVQYAGKAKNGVLYGNQESLSDAFSRLKTLFRFWGILTIVIIVFYIFAIASGILLGAR